MSDTKPYLIQIETTMACNATCPMCPRKLVERKSGQMSANMFWTVVHQAVDMGIGIICPFINGEPLMDNRITGWIERLALDFPKVAIGWYTNGSLLTPEISRRLLKAGNIKDFNVSMQGGDKATYERNTGLNWEKTIANVEDLIRINEELGRPANIRMNMCVFSQTKNSVAAFKKLWQGRAMICLGVFSNFGGLLHDLEGEAAYFGMPYRKCARALNHLYVLWNGDVCQCCFDVAGKVIYGNIEDYPLRQIWDSPKMIKMRLAHMSEDVSNLPVCGQCNSNRFNG